MNNKETKILGSSVLAEPLTIPSDANTITASLNTEVADPGRLKTMFLDLSWLVAASSIYNISNNVGDYVFAKVRSLTLELPNRNGHNFTMAEMVKFHAGKGRQAYRTFEGMPLLVNHEYVLEKAIGCIVTSDLVQEGPYVFVENIIAVDKTKHPEAAEVVRRGEAVFSMGANVATFQCSVCKALIDDLEKPCEHNKSATFLRPFSNTDNVVNLAFLNVHVPNFIELSYLENQDPADCRAWSSDTSVV